MLLDIELDRRYVYLSVYLWLHSRTIGLLAFLAHEFAHYLEKFSVCLLVQDLAWKMGLREGLCSRDSSLKVR